MNPEYFFVEANGMLLSSLNISKYPVIRFFATSLGTVVNFLTPNPSFCLVLNN